jgi:hypothetical protein
MFTPQGFGIGPALGGSLRVGREDITDGRY